MAAVAFDTLKLARKLRDTAQMSVEQAEGVADALAEAMSGAELATKPDIRELEQSTQASIRELEQSTQASLREQEQKTQAGFRELEQSTQASLREQEQRTQAEFQLVRSEIREVDLRSCARFDALNERIERRAAETESRIIRWVVGVGVGVGATAILTIVGAAWTIIRYLPSH